MDHDILRFEFKRKHYILQLIHLEEAVVIRSVEVVIHSEAAQPVIHSQVVEVSLNLKGVRRKF